MNEVANINQNNELCEFLDRCLHVSEEERIRYADEPGSPDDAMWRSRLFTW